MTMTVRTARKCPSTSGNTNLQYEIGCDGAKHPHFRITENEGGGLFSAEWVAWRDIQMALRKVEVVTSSPLKALFTRKSANTPGFLLAVLVKEKLVEALPDKTRHFKLLDPAPFLDRVANLKKAAKPGASTPTKKPAAKKAPPKKKAKK